MNYNYFKTQWKYEEDFVFQGWNFSHIDGRWKSEALPWDYREVVLSFLKSTDKLLDMGTGGGEFLLSLKHPFALTSVTEAYPQNVELCNEKLAPLGITVVPESHLIASRPLIIIFFNIRRVLRAAIPTGSQKSTGTILTSILS